MEPDPIGLEGGLNPYAYAGSNPVSNVDATGLYFTSDGTHIPNFDNLSNPLLGLSTTVNSYNPQSPLWYQDTQQILRSGVWSSNIAANYSAADVANNKAAYGQNGFYNSNYNSTQIAQYVVREGIIPALVGGVVARGAGIGSISAKPEFTTVTSWASAGTKPDLNPGRWVMAGEATKTNYVLTGLWGPKIPKYNVPFSNSVTSTVPTTQVAWPSGINIWRGVFGQRQIRK